MRSSEKGIVRFQTTFLYYRILGNTVAFTVGSDRLEKTAEFRVVLQEREQVVQVGDGDDGQTILFFDFLNGRQFARTFFHRLSDAHKPPADQSPFHQKKEFPCNLNPLTKPRE